jgi:hypothetical protein
MFNKKPNKSLGKILVKKAIALSLLGGLVTLATRLIREHKARD